MTNAVRYEDMEWKVGDLAFADADIPVEIEAITTFPDGVTRAAMVKYLGIGYPKGTSGIESLGDLTSETYEEYQARVMADYQNESGLSALPRRACDWQDRLSDIVGVATQERLVEWHQSIARAYEQRIAL